MKCWDDGFFNKIFLRSGKVKALYDVGKGRLLFIYTDRLASRDVKLGDSISYRGQVLCRLSAHCFENCEDQGIELSAKGWDQNQPAPGTRLTKPILPDEIILKTSQRYIEAYERLTGKSF